MYDPDSHELINNGMLNDEHAKIDQAKLNSSTLVSYYNQNDIIKLAFHRKFENCEIEADLAAMIMPVRVNNASKDMTTNNLAYTTFKAQLITKNNSHLLKAAPRTIPLTRNDRLKESNLRKYAHGKLNLNMFLKNLVNISLPFKFIGKNEDSSGSSAIQSGDDDAKSKMTIEFDNTNRVDIDLNQNTVDVFCDNEDIRLKIKDSLLKCLNVL